MSTVGTLYDETVKFGFAKLLSVQSVTSASFIDFIAPFAAGEVDKYSSYIFEIDGLVPTVDASLWILVSTDGGATWKTSGGGYSWEWGYAYANNPAVNYYGSITLGTTYMDHFQTGGSTYGLYAIDGRVKFNPGSNVGVKNFGWELSCLPGGSGSMAFAFGGGGYHLLSGINGVRFMFTVNTINSGTIRLYGLRKGT